MSERALVGRLVARDLRHRPGQAALMLLAITAATATLTLGLVLHGVTSQPYQQTRAATNGPDEVAYLGQPAVTGPKLQKQAQTRAGQLARAPGVTAASGPFPLAGALIRALGATPRNVAAGLTAAQLLPALPGALLGIPLGLGLFAAADHGGLLTVPPTWWLAVAVLATLAAVAGLAAIPARVGARRPAAEILRAETA